MMLHWLYINTYWGRTCKDHSDTVSWEIRAYFTGRQLTMKTEDWQPLISMDFGRLMARASGAPRDKPGSPGWAHVLLQAGVLNRWRGLLKLACKCCLQAGKPTTKMLLHGRKTMPQTAQFWSGLPPCPSKAIPIWGPHATCAMGASPKFCPAQLP